MYDEDTGCLSWIHEHELNGSGGSSSSSTAYFAYFPPYSYERHLGLVARCAGMYTILLRSRRGCMMIFHSSGNYCFYLFQFYLRYFLTFARLFLHAVCK